MTTVMETITIKDKIFTELFSEKELKEIIENCVSQIKTSVAETENLILIGVLNGAVPFLNEIAFSLPENISIDYVKAVSYGDNTFSSGKIKLLLDTQMNLNGKDILLVDDIIDTGCTVQFLIEHFKAMGAKSIKTCCLFYKKNPKIEAPDFYGAIIDDEFIVGFGLDYAQNGRNLKKIIKLSE
ncbi:MAG: hypoxanthine phosphoribosyltransferase [Candidatus Delongbacteria bacterium]|nr:hypoxanthine phosphoribosyltransferase [Candidatus Delongbacteria bacterium]MCG2759603.1 hypoxanthine phosphoribosyltransferase [Candidatus Delongbacteria bacterium]